MMHIREFSSNLSDILGRKIVFFCGKGGTGKTVCAAAAGLWAAKKSKKTLVLSSDPAHSLSDVFGQEIGNRITQINGVSDLYAFEADPYERLKELKSKLRPHIEGTVYELGKGPVSLERDLLEELFEMVPPGIDELLGLEKVNELLRGLDGGEFETIVIDTAAGAHALRLLEFPKLIEQWIEKFLDIFDRVIRREAKGAPTKIVRRHMVPISELIYEFRRLAREAKRLRETISDPETTFITVTIPELMGTFVTIDMIEALKKIGAHSDTIVVNYLIPQSKCEFCSSVRENQLLRVKEIQTKFPQHRIIKVPLFPNPITGLDVLDEFAKSLFEGYEPAAVEVRKVRETPPLLTKRLEFPGDLKLLMFGGKGGCGKTTFAASVGIWLARRGRRVLLVSTDPQRSLSDALCKELHVSRILPLEKIPEVSDVPNLYAMEIDTGAVIDDLKKRYETAIMQMAVGATKLKEDETKSFLSLPIIFPGGDEVFALWKISKVLALREYDLVILDTAPTGHTMRFLELPETLSKWVKFLLKVREKTKHLQRFFKRGQKYEADLFLEEMVEDCERILKALKCASTEFIPVTTLDEMALRELDRFLKILRAYEMPVNRMIVNKLILGRDCGYCMRYFSLQSEKLLEVQKTYPEIEFVCVPHLGHEVLGIEELENFGRILFGEPTQN